MKPQISVDAAALYRLLEALGFRGDNLILYYKNNQHHMNNPITILIDQYNEYNRMFEETGGKLRSVK